MSVWALEASLGEPLLFANLSGCKPIITVSRCFDDPEFIHHEIAQLLTGAIIEPSFILAGTIKIF